MLVRADSIQNQRVPLSRGALIYLASFLSFCFLVQVLIFFRPLSELVHRWRAQEEYSHGFLIPVIAAWLLWTRREAIIKGVSNPSWWGPLLIAFAGALHALGELSAVWVLSQVGFVLALMGLALGIGGRTLLKVVFVPLLFLLFAIPTPYFVDAMLSFRLQLLSSEIGTFFIRLMGIPVFLEGNVIDLGVYKLQVVDACSGLRYLYPLLSLGFLAAYLYQAPMWQRVIVFLSAIPITIVMNSFRIGVVGVLVNYWGPQDADGFLHMFEGWIIFLACACILLLEMSLMARIFLRRNFWDVFGPAAIVAESADSPNSKTFNSAPLVSCLAVIILFGIGTSAISTRHEVLPQRKLFALFPNQIADWRGRPSALDAATERGLALTDYILADYSKNAGSSVNLYIAYYASQRSGASPHSPSVCIPGNGWQITRLQETQFDDAGRQFPINRAVISNGTNRQLVYYWYEERGMTVANEWLSKLYLLRDAIFKNRTDGALIRVITPLYPGENEAAGDARLHAFVVAMLPQLHGFLPGTEASSTTSPRRL